MEFKGGGFPVIVGGGSRLFKPQENPFAITLVSLQF